MDNRPNYVPVFVQMFQIYVWQDWDCHADPDIRYAHCNRFGLDRSHKAVIHILRKMLGFFYLHFQPLSWCTLSPYLSLLILDWHLQKTIALRATAENLTILTMANHYIGRIYSPLKLYFSAVTLSINSHLQLFFV